MRSDLEDPFPRIELRLELACSLSKVQDFLGKGGEDLRVRLKEYDFKRSFSIPKILIELEFPSCP